MLLGVGCSRFGHLDEVILFELVGFVLVCGVLVLMLLLGGGGWVEGATVLLLDGRGGGWAGH